MADDLGSAVLQITIDDGAARKQLENLKKAIEGFNPKFKGVERELAAVATQADAAKVRVQSLNQVLNQAPGASYSKISAQIQRLARESRDLQIQSEQYVKTLQRISELEFVRGSRAGRQRTRADFEAAQGSVLTRGFGAPDRLPTLPPTIAGDLQRIRELTFLLRNLDVNSAEFGVTQRQLAEAQRRVADATEGTSEAFRRQQLAQDGVIRRAEKLRQVQEYYGGLNPRAGGIRDPESGAMIARGAGAAADERAYRAALRASQDLLETDLKRLQVVRQLAQQLAKTTAARTASQESGFVAFSQGIGGSAVDRSIRRATERRAQLEERRTAQLDALDADLARIREQRNAAERRALQLGAAPQRRGLVQGGVQRLLGEPLPVPPLPSGYFPGLQRQQQEALRRRRDITSNALIGGAFPLLFGQGLGASLGGAAGGGAGGAIGGQFGFGLSLLGTAVGAQFDAIIQKATLLGQALDNPIKNFAALQQGALLSSKGLERQVESLIAVGRESEAAALIQQDLARSYGGAEAAKRLASEQDRLNRSWAQFSVNLGQLALSPIADAATDAASALRGLNQILELISRFRPPGGGDIPTGVGRVAGNILNPAGGILGGLGAAARFLFPPAPQAPTTTPTTGAAEARRNTLLSAQYRQITAQVQGYKDLAIAAEKQVSLEQEREDIANLRARGLAPDDPQILRRQSQGAQERFKLEEEQGKLQRDNAAKALKDEQDRAQAARETAAAYQLISAESEIQLRAVRQQISDAAALAATPAGAVRETLAARQQALADVSAARDRELQLGAEIGAARLRGDETEAFRLVQQQEIAAEQTKLALIEGSTALSDASTKLLEDAQNTTRSLQGLREDNLRFQTPEEQRRTLQALDEEVRTELQRRGLQSLTVSGPPEQQLREKRAFVEFGREEQRLTKQSDTIAKAIALANKPLVDSSGLLGTQLDTVALAVGELARKDWTVYVNGIATALPAAQQNLNNAAIS